MKKVLVICGATATGKTALAIDCAKKLHTEIISADSQLIYKGLSVGTAKPTEKERDGIVHHLIDVIEPNETFSVSDYKTRALPILEGLIYANKTPIVCGGTGFYIESLLYESAFGNVGASVEIREKYERIEKEKGKSYLHELLEKVDEESARILHENDVKRVIRALEIFELTGKKKSEQRDEKSARFPFVAVCIDFPRDELYSRIDRRVDEMFSRGLVDEVKTLLSRGITLEYQCMQAIGYKEIARGLSEGKTEDEMKEGIKKATRNYAKRQITFFKRLENVCFLKKDEATAERVLALL